MGPWRVLRGEVCHSSWKASLLPTPFTLAEVSEHQLLTGCDPASRSNDSMCSYSSSGLFHRAGHWRGPHIHPVLREMLWRTQQSKDDVAGLLYKYCSAPWIHPGSGIGAEAFGRSSQSHCELRNGPCYSDIQLEFQECMKWGHGQVGERRNCHLWGSEI